VKHVNCEVDVKEELCLVLPSGDWYLETGVELLKWICRRVVCSFILVIGISKLE
jgi:hypothetical protein